MAAANYTITEGSVIMSHTSVASNNWQWVYLVFNSLPVPMTTALPITLYGFYSTILVNVHLSFLLSM